MKYPRSASFSAPCTVPTIGDLRASFRVSGYRCCSCPFMVGHGIEFNRASKSDGEKMLPGSLLLSLSATTVSENGLATIKPPLSQYNLSIGVSGGIVVLGNCLCSFLLAGGLGKRFALCSRRSLVICARPRRRANGASCQAAKGYRGKLELDLGYRRRLH